MGMRVPPSRLKAAARALARCAMVLLVLGLARRPARAETVDQAYARALQEHYAGHYHKAVDELERILAIPLQHPDLHYNLGCAYFRLGLLGPAIFHFERALALESGAEDARFNLQTARALATSRVKDELRGAAVDPWWVRLVGLLGSGGWAVAFLVLWWLTFGVLLALRFVNPGPLRAGLVAGTSFVAILAVVCGLVLLAGAYHSGRVRYGIVLPNRMEVREGPGSGTRVTFKLHAGFKVRLQARENGWVRIRLPNGLEGWVLRDQVGML